MKKLLWLPFAFFLLFSCRTRGQLGFLEAGPAWETETEIEESPLHEKTPDSFVFLATGDNLFHISIINDFCEGGYNFTPVYSQIRELVQAADLAYINQETVMGGAQFSYSGYPRFNTPQTLAPILAEMGFSIVNHANNHALDMGEKGLLATLDVWAAIPGISCLGARQSAEKKSVIVTKNNISLGFLAYTYGTNGLPLPKDKPWLVSLIERKTMAEEIDALRPLCDFLLVSMHWGDEYTREPSAGQISLARFLAEHNVDLVIGHHPHVLQRFDSLPRQDGKKMLCFYSLGNFVSNQDRRETLLGGVLYAKFKKDGTELSIVDEGIIPVVTHYEQGYTKTRVIPLYEYGDELAAKHRHYSLSNGINVAYFHSLLSGLNTEIKLRNPFLASSDDDP